MSLIGSIIQIYPFGYKPSAPPVGSYLFYIKTDNTLYLQDSSGTEFPFGSASFISQLSGDVSAVGPGNATATVNSVGGSSASNINTATLAVLAATNLNTASTLVSRDASGNFSAGTITANLLGNATSATSATSAISFSGSLSGDVTGTQGSTVVSSVGGVSASSVASGANLANAATSFNTGNDIVKRDNSGNFSAGTITANLVGNASTATTSTNFSGSLSGDVTGTQSSTSIADTTVTGKVLTGFVSGSGSVTATDTILQAIGKLAGGGVPGGSNTQIQYNNSGAFAGSPNLTWDQAKTLLSINSPTTPTTSAVLAVKAVSDNLGDHVILEGPGTSINRFLYLNVRANGDLSLYNPNGSTGLTLTNNCGVLTHGIAAGTYQTEVNGISPDTNLANAVADYYPTLAIKNVDSTDGNYSQIQFDNGQTNDSSIFGVHDSHTLGAESGHLEFWTKNAGSYGSRLIIAKDGTLTFPKYGTGFLRSNSSGVVSSSLLSGSDLPNPSSSTLGGVQSIAAVPHNFLTSISTSGVPTQAQPAFTDISGSVDPSQMPAFTGDVTTTAGSVVTTLATVNSNVGSFGSASSVGSFTVNAKGLITAAANTAIQIAEAQVTGLISDLAGKQPTGNYVTGGSGDVSFSGPGVATTTVNSVGGSSAANIHAAELLANAATALDTPSTIVFRDASGNFSANIISAALNGNVTGNVTGNLTGNVTGNVTGTAGNITATTNSTLLTLPSLTLPGAQVSGNIAGSAGSVSGTNVITNSNLAQMPANTIKGNNTGSLANAVDLTAAQVTALLNPFTGDTGSGGLQGLVPAPGAGTKAAGDFLSAVGSWAYVDQSKPIYSPFSLVGITQWTGAVNAKYENIVTYTGIDGHKQYAAIVAGGGAGTLFIWDITNPAIPTLCSYVSLSGAYNIAIAQISGAIYAFVPSSGASVLYTINITNPYSLSTTSSLTISGSPGSLYGCVYANGYVYIGTQNKGLTVVDVGGGLAGGTITVPIQSYQEGGTTNKTSGIAIFGNFVYTTNYQTTFPATVRYFKTWELAAGSGTLAVPFLANTYTIPGGPTPTSTKPSGITISPSGTTAYVSDGNQGVINILDITSPTSPAYVTYITPSYTLVTNTLEEVAVAATVNGNYLYVPSGFNATNGGCIDLFDVTTPASPVKVKSVYTGIPNDVFGGIALNSGYIFAADYGASGGYSSMAVFTQAALSPVFGLPVTSNIQVQQLTPNTALIANGSQQLASSSTTATELSYVHGVTSPIQAQINSIAGSGITSLTGDGTAIGPGSAAFTLATVNSNVGSFGSASSVSQFTVNAKGLVTAAANTSIQIAESQVTNLTSDLNTLATNSIINAIIFG